MDQQPQQNKSRRTSVQKMYVPVHKRAETTGDPTQRDDQASQPEVSRSSVRRGRGKFQAPSEAALDEETAMQSPKGRDFDATQLRTYAPDDSKRSSRANKHRSMPVSEHSIAAAPKHIDGVQEKRRSRLLQDDHRASLGDMDKLGNALAGLSTGGSYDDADEGQREEWEDLLKEYDHYETNETDSPRLMARKKRLSSHIDLFAAPPAEAPVIEEPTTVLDCYDFPPAFKTHHLHDIFREYENMRGGYRIKWLEDTRALIIFEHPSSAKKAYIDNVSNPLAKIRPYSGSVNVLRSTSQGQLPRRPPTTDMVARRLVHGALGVRAPRSKEQRQAEKDVLKSARDEQKNKKEQETLRATEVSAAFDE
ncbi:hypothetical protein BC943DRAFT_313780 [Umbelopsis sp. AD052]|nr:hypothetical protein BC943DRAFT_313780 [Umbelopsis sp. AD052]